MSFRIIEEDFIEWTEVWLEDRYTDRLLKMKNQVFRREKGHKKHEQRYIKNPVNLSYSGAFMGRLTKLEKIS